MTPFPGRAPRERRARSPVPALLLALAQGAPGSVPVEAQPRPPDVLLVVLDDVGYLDVELIETPTLDELARRGRRFRRAYAMPACEGARATLMFGRYLESAGPSCADAPTDETPPADTFCLPALFEGLGYDTAFLGKWHLGTNRAGQPWSFTPQVYGFDRSFAVVTGNVGASCDGFRGDYYAWQSVDDGAVHVERTYHSRVLLERFTDWWTHASGPRFAFVSFQAAHVPFQAPPAELLPHEPSPAPGSRPHRASFERLVISADFVLHEMLTVVDLSKTYVVVLGDNGTPPNATSAGQRPHKVKSSVYEGGIHVPLLVLGPGIRPGDTEALASLADVLPTLAELAGAPARVPDGHSLVPVLADPDARVRDHAFAALRGQRAVVQSRFKLVRAGRKERFYDLDADASEDHPLDPDELPAESVTALRRAMAGYVERGF